MDVPQKERDGQEAVYKGGLMMTYVDIEFNVEIDFDGIPAERTTRHHRGHHAHIQVNCIRILDVEVTGELEKKIMEEYGASIEEACWEYLEG